MHYFLFNSSQENSMNNELSCKEDNSLNETLKNIYKEESEYSINTQISLQLRSLKISRCLLNNFTPSEKRAPILKWVHKEFQHSILQLLYQQDLDFQQEAITYIFTPYKIVSLFTHVACEIVGEMCEYSNATLLQSTTHIYQLSYKNLFSQFLLTGFSLKSMRKTFF